MQPPSWSQHPELWTPFRDEHHLCAFLSANAAELRKALLLE